MPATLINPPELSAFFEKVKVLSQKEFAGYSWLDTEIKDVEEQEVKDTVLKDRLSFLLYEIRSCNSGFPLY